MSVATMSRYRRKEPILGCVPKNDEKKNSRDKGLKAFENTTQNMLNGHYYAVSKIKMRDGAALAVLIKQLAALSGIKNFIKYLW